MNSYDTPLQAPDGYGSPVSDPVDSYDAPVPASDGYGTPISEPNNSYDAPVQAPDSYGSPISEPNNSYDAPVQAPDGYGTPASEPQNSYDAPVPASDGYGTPVSAPENVYDAPVPAADDYGIPASNPVNSYSGPQTANNGFGSNFGTNSFGPPSTVNFILPSIGKKNDIPRPPAPPATIPLHSTSSFGIPRPPSPPSGIPLPLNGVLVDVPVQHNLPQQFLSSGVTSKTNSLEVLPLFQGTENFANQELPGYGDDSLPGYENNPLPTYNNDNVNSGNNDDLPSYKPEQQIYDPFTFQAENAPPTPASNRPPAPNQPPPNRQPVNRPPSNREPTLNIDNDVEFIDPLESLPDLPDFEAPVNANLNIRNRTRPSSGQSFSFSQIGSAPAFGFSSNNNNQLPESGIQIGSNVFNPFGVSVASGFGGVTPTPGSARLPIRNRSTTTTTTTTTTRRTTRRTTTTTTTTRTTTRRTTRRTTTTQRTSRRPAFQQQNLANGFNFNQNINNRPLPPTFAPISFNTLPPFNFAPRPGVPVFSFGAQTTRAPSSLFNNQFQTTPSSSFFPNSEQSTRSPTRRPSRRTTQRTTRRTTTTRTTTRRTTRRPVLLQQSLSPQFNVDTGLSNRPAFTAFNSPSSVFGKPEKLTIGSLSEITGDSGIFFSTPATSFVTPEDFGTPAPNRPLSRTTEEPSTNTASNSVEQFSDNLILTSPSPFGSKTTASPFSRQITPSPFARSPKPNINVGHNFRGNSGVNNNQNVFGTTAAPTNQPEVIPNNFVPNSNSLRPLEQFREAPGARNTKRQSKNAINTEVEVKRNSIEDGQSVFDRRNMLMNIILRPGGGDTKKALPRPKVEVSSEGSNVIIVRLTFPDNENIHGLRAFTPSDPRELQQFDELRETVAPDVRVERIQAISSEESDEDDFVDTRPTSDEFLATLDSKIVNARTRFKGVTTSPTRPTRPPKKEKLTRKGKTEKKRPSLSYLPPPGQTVPKSNPSTYFNFIGASSEINVPAELNLPFSASPKSMINKNHQFFQLSKPKLAKNSRIKPRNPQDAPPPPTTTEKPKRYFYPVTEAFHPHENMDDNVVSLDDYLAGSKDKETSNEVSNHIRSSVESVDISSAWKPPRPKAPPLRRKARKETKPPRTGRKEISRVDLPRPRGTPPYPSYRDESRHIPGVGINILNECFRYPILSALGFI